MCAATSHQHHMGKWQSVVSGQWKVAMDRNGGGSGGNNGRRSGVAAPGGWSGNGRCAAAVAVANNKWRWPGTWRWQRVVAVAVGRSVGSGRGGREWQRWPRRSAGRLQVASGSGGSDQWPVASPFRGWPRQAVAAACQRPAAASAAEWRQFGSQPAASGRRLRQWRRHGRKWQAVLIPDESLATQ